MSNKRSDTIANIAFYAILLFCLAGVGAGAYLILFPAAPAPAEPQTQQPSFTVTPDDHSQVTEIIQPTTVPDTIPDPVPAETDPILPAEPVQAEPVQPEPPLEEVKPVAAIPVIPEYEPPAETVSKQEVPAAAVLADPVITPLEGEIVAAFSMDTLVYNATLADWRTHDGVDISAEAGTGVLAAAAGTVADIREDELLGTTVVLQHADGTRTTYASLSPELNVKFSERVEAGQLIGAVGSSAVGEAAAGPHLHFSVTKDGIAMDPMEYLAS